MLPFDGCNSRSVLVTDNASIHHVDDVIGLVEEVGALVHFLPPYSPNMNPIEEAFSKVKGFLKASDPLIQVQESSQHLHQSRTMSAMARIITLDTCMLSHY